MIELDRHIETEVIQPNLTIDEDTLFDLPTINYVDDKGNHWITNGIGGICVVILNKDWNTFLDNLYTIKYRKGVLGERIPVREKLDPLEFKRHYLYQLAQNHTPILSDENVKVLDTKTLHSKMKIRSIDVTSV